MYKSLYRLHYEEAGRKVPMLHLALEAWTFPKALLITSIIVEIMM
jgi:hypothetical protein